jgi:hypothetical protein
VRENRTPGSVQGAPGNRCPYCDEGQQSMKSKVRNIVVDSETYVWGVSKEDGHNVKIKVWKGGNKRIPLFEITKEFDDPWLNYSELSKGDLKSSLEGSTPVTPGLIAAYIQEKKTGLGFRDEQASLPQNNKKWCA